MINYLFLCLVTSFAGVGIFYSLSLMRAPLLSFRLTFYLAPVITLACWTLFLGWGVLFGYPIKILALPGWLLTSVFLLLGLYITLKKICSATIKISDITTPLLALILPVLVMSAYFSHGLMSYGGADAPDGWSYIAVGQSLWENIRSAEGQLVPLHQYAAHLAHVRFISSAMLAFLSPFVGHPGDTQITSNLFQAWALFNLTSACIFFAITQHLKKWTLIYVIFVVYSVWIFKLLAVNNFDNLLALCLLPAFAGITQLKKLNPFIYALIFALLSAITFFIYVELAPFILGGAILFLFQQLWAQNKLTSVKTILLILILSFILISPYMKEGINFFLDQLRNAHALDGRAGEGYFPELTSCRHRLTAILGGAPNSVLHKLFGFIFLCLLVRGFVVLWREKQYSLVIFCVLLIFAAADMMFIKHYSYGTYKIFLLSWWLIAFCVIIAIRDLLQRRHKRITMTLVILLGIFHFYMAYSIQKSYARIVSIKNIEPYRNLSQITSLLRNKAIIVDIDDGMASEWAVYYLRHLPIKLTTYRIYMLNARALMDRSKTINPSDLEFLLTDHQTSKNLIWSSGPYYLYDLKTSSPSPRQTSMISD
jgi:hypothetical protein